MIKRLFLITLILLISTTAYSAMWVTQNGAGSGNGTSLENAYSIASFNALTGTKSGITYYFSGTISTRVQVKIKGTNGSPVVLDGYEADDCSPLTATCSSSAILSSGMAVGAGTTYDVDYATIQDFRMTVTSGSDPCLWVQGTGDNDNIIIQRNHVYDSHASLFNIRNSNYLEMRGNKFVNFAQGQSNVNQGVNFQHVDYALITSNEFGHDESSYPSTCTSCNTVEVHSSNYMLWEYNDIYGAPNQAGVAVKEDNTQQRHIWRYNRIHDNNEVGLNLGGGYDYLNNMYVYANMFYKNGTAGGSSYDGGTYHYWWSNLFINNNYYGFLTWNRSQGSLNNIFLYNNTFVYNGDRGSDPYQVNRGGIVLQAGSNFTVKNNIFYYNRPLNGNNSWYWQIYDNVDGVFEHNTFYHPDATATWYYDSGVRTLATMQAPPYDLEDDSPPGKVTDPGLTDPDGADNTYGTVDDDNTLDGSLVDDGATNLSQCFDVTISAGGYGTVTVCTQYGIDPNNTDWSAVPPTVATLDRQTYGWDRGAYVYATGGTPGDTTPPTLLSASINSSGTTITLNFSEVVTEGGTGSDWALTLSGGAVTFSNPSVALDVTYDLSRTIIEGETVSVGLNYTQPGNGIEDGAGNDMVSITSFSVTNNSIVPNPTTYTGVGITVQ